MLASKLLVSAALFLAAHGLAVPAEYQKRSGPGFLKLDFDVTKGTKGLRGGKDREPYAGLSASNSAGAYVTNLTNQNIFYSTNITVGSENSLILVDIDTGSSDLWVIAANGTDGFAANTQSLQAAGYLDPTKSSSLTTNNEEFFITYGDNSFAYGEYVTDNVAIQGGPGINVQFGLAFTTVINQGIFGIGYNNLEATDDVYPNFPATLKADGYISKNAYSLYLNAPNATSGSVIFGGYDTEKIDGSLATLSTLDDSYLAVNLTSVSVGGLNGTSGGNSTTAPVNSPVLLDSGTTITYLPGDVYQTLINSLPGGQTDNGWEISVEQAQGLSFDYQFNNVTVKVPLESLVGPAYDQDGNLLPYTTLQVNTGDVLGDNFLRYAYVIYDLDDQKISIGQAKYTDDSNIVVIS